MNSLQWLQLVSKTCLVLFFHRIIFASILKNENVAKPAESRSSSSIITRLQKLCHVFSLFLTCCSLGALLRRIQVLVLCLPPAYLCLCVCVCELCLCLCDIFPLQFSLLFGTLTARLLFAYLPAYLPTWQFHNVPPNMWGSLSLAHKHTRTSSMSLALSNFTLGGHIDVCEWVSEHAKTNALSESSSSSGSNSSIKRERENELCWAQQSVNLASRRIWKRVSQSLAHLRRFSCFRALGAFVWFSCVHGRSRRVRFAGQQYYIHTHTIHTHIQINKQHQNQHLIRIEKENCFSVCIESILSKFVKWKKIDIENCEIILCVCISPA